jgi:hypothetical protein
MDLSARQQQELRAMEKRLTRERRISQLADLVTIRDSHPLRYRVRLICWFLRYGRTRGSRTGARPVDRAQS